jgi:hypothetical protein
MILRFKLKTSAKYVVGCGLSQDAAFVVVFVELHHNGGILMASGPSID